MGATATYRPETADLLFRWDVVSMPGFRSPVPQNSGVGGAVPGVAGLPGLLYGAEFGLGDRTFEVRALGTSHDPSFLLFDCTTECSQQAELTGGIGTAGEDVRVRVPVQLFGAPIEGTVLRSLQMFTAGGTGQVAQVPRLDAVTLGDAAVPARSVMLGRAPTGTPAAEVPFDEVAVMERGRFSASLDHPDRGEDVWARACFGPSCETLRAQRA